MIESGRELDARIAEKIFKWRALYTKDGTVRELWPPTVDPFSPKLDWSQCAEPPDWGLVPYYSTSIADAWRLVIKMTDRMGSANYPDFSWEGPLYKPPMKDLNVEACPLGVSCWYVCVESGVERKIFCAETPPLVICIAALEIIESEEQVNRDLKEIRPRESTAPEEQQPPRIS
ncbi:MAG: hypothetical protein WKF84_13885 [Pyrinomonadaceae bacterium]